MPFDIIIPAAGHGQRMGAKSPKGLISLGAETVLQRQIRLLTSAYPGCRIIVVAGHKHEQLYRSISKQLGKDVGFVVNRDYATGNVAQSIKVGLESVASGRPALVVYGDLVFNSKALPEWNESGIIVDECPHRESEVGVSELGGYVSHFAYGLPEKWSHIVYLSEPERKLFIDSCLPAHHAKYFGFEILKQIIKAGGSFSVVRPPGMQLVEIDTSKDIPHAVELAQQ